MRFEGSDRPSDINLMQFFHNGTCVIGSYKPGTALKGGKLHLDVSKIKWLTSTGEAPTDGQRGL